MTPRMRRRALAGIAAIVVVLGGLYASAVFAVLIVVQWFTGGPR